MNSEIQTVPAKGWLKGLLVLLALGFGCEGFSPKSEVYEPEYMPEVGVFGLISAESEYTFVVVERTVTLQERNEMLYADAAISTVIEGALVTVSSGPDSVIFEFSRGAGPTYPFYRPSWQKGVYQDRRNRLRVVPGNYYRLHVKLPDGRTVTGETRVPLRPQITWPADGARISLAEAEKRQAVWTDDQGTAAYRLDLYVPVYDWIEGRFRYMGPEQVLEDFVVIDPRVDMGELLRSVPFIEGVDSLRVTLEVTAVDPNLYDYMRSNTGLAEPSGTTLNLLEGALGVFGSVSVSRVEFVLLR